MNLSPSALFVFNRLWYSKKTIEVIKNNELTLDFELFILKDNTMNNKKRNQALKQLKRDTSQFFFHVHN
jgi:hypothetical protein